jgi:spermidine/putrescine-binding protein
LGLFGCIVLFVAVILPFASCGRSKPALNVYTWADYVKPGLLSRFEKENGCRVEIDTF